MTDTSRMPRRCLVVAVMLGLIGCISALAQEADQPPPVNQERPPAATQAQPADAGEAEQMPKAVVIEVAGPVEWSLPGLSPLVDEGWTPVQLNDTYEPGTQIRTGLRAHVNLKFGETTVVSIRSATHASIDQFYRSATTETIRVGLAYGTVRGGSTEGPIKADVEVDSTVATLSKRGTEGWQMWVEPSTNRFRVSLAEHGLVDAIQRIAPGRTRSKSVRPGEYATPDNIANLWIAQAKFDRNVQFYPAETVTVADARFANRNTGGLGVVAPGAGASLYDYAGRSASAANATGSDLLRTAPSTLVFRRVPLPRPEGNFGTGTTFRVLRPAR